MNNEKKGIIGKCIGTQSLQNLVRYSQNELLKKGMITTQITAQPQDLNTGILEPIQNIFYAKVALKRLN
ncbi:hypothetical protein O1450_09345 [Acinetobacter sp. TR11]|nr:POTRA domain-containing protein [Acinetobacter sp. TR11]WAU72331.1 hypothetical protein O1450_09345 [Acinetobacter sp. TR11]